MHQSTMRAVSLAAALIAATATAADVSVRCDAVDNFYQDEAAVVGNWPECASFYDASNPEQAVLIDSEHPHADSILNGEQDERAGDGSISGRRQDPDDWRNPGDGKDPGGWRNPGADEKRDVSTGSPWWLTGDKPNGDTPIGWKNGGAGRRRRGWKPVKDPQDGNGWKEAGEMSKRDRPFGGSYNPGQGQVDQRATPKDLWGGSHNPGGHNDKREDPWGGSHNPGGHNGKRDTDEDLPGGRGGNHNPANDIVQREGDWGGSHNPGGHHDKRGDGWGGSYNPGQGQVEQRATPQNPWGGNHNPGGHSGKRDSDLPPWGGSHNPAGHVGKREGDWGGNHNPAGHKRDSDLDPWGGSHNPAGHVGKRDTHTPGGGSWNPGNGHNGKRDSGGNWSPAGSQVDKREDGDGWKHGGSPGTA